MIPEAEAIARFAAPFATSGPGVIAGPGDDCALTRVTPGRVLVQKVDQIVEGVHFTSAFRPEEIGHKALAVALSDLCAAGATPKFLLCAVALPASFSARALDRLAAGMAALARQAKIILVGGNFTRARELSLACTVLGEARRGVRREGARPGDRLLVTGALGGAAAWA